MEEERGAHPMIDRLRAQRVRHRERRRVSRVGFAIAGFVLVLGGVAMLVLPGPGLVVIALGLGLLALEFDWAERWLERTLVRSEQATDVAREAPLWQKIVAGILLAAAAAALVAAVVLYDIPFFPG